MLPTTRHRDTTTSSRPRFGRVSRLLQDEWDQLLLHTRRNRRRVSKNCKNLRKYGYTYIGFRSNTTNRQERQMVESLTQQVMELERRRALLESMDLARFANIRQHAMACVDTYYERFRDGYDPLHSESLDAMVRSILTEDCASPSFPDVDTFLRQWCAYSTYHASTMITIESITSVPDADNTNHVIIQCKGLTTSRISRATIEHLFKPILNDEVLVQQLIGREYSFSFCTLFHFNTQGRVGRMEPRAELATGILNLISDPFTTVRLLGASRLSTDGYLHAYEEE